MTQPVRIQLRRTKGWRMPENTVKVDRSTIWGNPYQAGEPGIPDVESAIELYRIGVERGQGRRWQNMRRSLDLIKGKNLACWCPLDAPCHADVLLEIANAPEVDE